MSALGWQNNGKTKHTYLPPSYGEGRFAVVRLLAMAGQGYAVLVKDTFTGGYGVLKGLWWEQKYLDEPRRAAVESAKKNERIRQGAEAVRRLTQLNQQAPVIVETVAEASPTLRANEPDALVVPEEVFAVQQFIGIAGQAARTLKELIEERAERNARFAEMEVLDLAAQLCDTLTALHGGDNRGRDSWVHADIKPGNILVLGPPWRYMLIDYDGAIERGTRIPNTTDRFAPPKEAYEDGEFSSADPQFDIYMLGATLAEAAACRPLDETVRKQLYGTFKEHGEAKAALRDLKCGPILTTVIASCLASQDGRFRQASAIAADLALARDAAVLSDVLVSGNWS